MHQRHPGGKMTRRDGLTFRRGRARARNATRPRNNRRSDDILEAALRLFSEQGYTAVSIKDIAKAGRVNSALIYYYFASKEHLFVEALKYSARIAGSHHQHSKEGRDDPVAKINFWFDANVKMAMPLGQMLRLMLEYRATRKRSVAIERLITDFYAAEIGLLRDAIERGIKGGLFEPVDTIKTSLFVSTHLDGLMVAASIRPDYDLRAGFLQMRKILFAWLGYEKGIARRRSGARARLRAVA
jgi:TetR/AcrR family transcriptional regulator, upper aerobic nicotinate degradation pathway regulator